MIDDPEIDPEKFEDRRPADERQRFLHDARQTEILEEARKDREAAALLESLTFRSDTPVVFPVHEVMRAAAVLRDRAEVAARAALGKGVTVHLGPGTKMTPALASIVAAASAQMRAAAAQGEAVTVEPPAGRGRLHVSGVRRRIDSYNFVQICDESGKFWALVPYGDRTPDDHRQSYADARAVAAALSPAGASPEPSPGLVRAARLAASSVPAEEREALQAKILASVAAFNRLSPEEQEEQLRVQRQSWVRGEMGISAAERAEGGR